MPLARRPLASALLTVTLAGCSSMSGSGPTSGAIVRAGTPSNDVGSISVVELDGVAAGRAASFSRSTGFHEVFGDVPPSEAVVDVGDVLDVVIWEAPPAVLFGATAPDIRIGATVAQSAGIPQQVVGEDGTIMVPFAGSIPVRGLTPRQIGRIVVQRLAGRAHAPQAIIRIAQNESRSVTIMGEVGATRRLPVTARGERLLDAIAAAGGPRQPIAKTTVQIVRGGRSATMPLEAVVRDPAQNIVLKAGDVVTAVAQPFSFVALGAVGQNAEVPFEGAGITLAQALGRVGGLRDDRASAQGVFVFRLEHPGALAPAVAASAKRAADGRVPVVYRLNLRDGTSLFTAQQFAIRDRDVIYVSNAPIADLQKVLSIVSSAAFSVTGIDNALR